MRGLLDSWPDSGYEKDEVREVWHLAVTRAIGGGVLSAQSRYGIGVRLEKNRMWRLAAGGLVELRTLFSAIVGLSRLGAEDLEQEETCADDDAGVGDVEVGPVVVVDADGEESTTWWKRMRS